jgi:hypothetical protein
LYFIIIIIIITTDIIASLSAFCVFVVYFMTLPYSETVAQMGGSLVNDEMKNILKEILVAQIKYFPGIRLKRRRKIAKYLSQDKRFSGLHSNRVLSE